MYRLKILDRPFHIGLGGRLLQFPEAFSAMASTRSATKRSRRAVLALSSSVSWPKFCGVSGNIVISSRQFCSGQKVWSPSSSLSNSLSAATNPHPPYALEQMRIFIISPPIVECFYINKNITKCSIALLL